MRPPSPALGALTATQEARRPIASDAAGAGEGAPPLRREFLRLLIVSALVPALLLGLADLVNQYFLERARLRAEVARVARLSASTVDSFMQAHLSAVTLAADLRDTGIDGQTLRVLRERYPAFLTTLATDARGDVLHAEPAIRARGRPVASVADREYFQVPARTLSPHVSDAFLGRRLGTDPLVAVSAPILDQGRFAGVVEGSVHVDRFIGLRSRTLHERGLEMLLVDRDGHVIHASEELDLPFRSRPALPDVRAATPEAALVRAAMPGGRNAWVAREQLESGWTLFLFAPTDTVVRPLLRQAATLAIVLLMIAAGAWYASRRQSDYLGRLLDRLLARLEAIATGRRGEEADPRALPAELRPLAEAVSSLAGRLDASLGELRQTVADQQRLAASLQETVDLREQEIAARTAELRRVNAELDQLNRTDPLTGCGNLRGLEQERARLADRDGCSLKPIAACAVDVDHFKAYNDRYGHPAGDAVLRRVAGALSSALRVPADILVRSGGEEFIALLPEADAGTAQEVAERMRAAVASLGMPHAATGTGLGIVTVSVGVAVAPPGTRVEDLLASADAALYAAKQQGRNRVAC